MLSEFDFEVVHNLASPASTTDCLSRFPAASSHDSTGVRQEGELEGGCVWSAAACLAWAPLLTGTHWQVPVTERGQMSRPGQLAVGGKQLGAAALPQQGAAERRTRSAGKQPAASAGVRGGCLQSAPQGWCCGGRCPSPKVALSRQSSGAQQDRGLQCKGLGMSRTWRFWRCCRAGAIRWGVGERNGTGYSIGPGSSSGRGGTW